MAFNPCQDKTGLTLKSPVIVLLSQGINANADDEYPDRFLFRQGINNISVITSRATDLLGQTFSLADAIFICQFSMFGPVARE